MKRLLTIVAILGILIPSVSFAAKAWTVDTGGTLSNGLISYFDLGSVVDSFGTSTLTNNGAVEFNGGKFGNAADGGASNSDKWLSTANTMGVNGTAISVSAWVRVTTAPTSGNSMMLWGQENSGTKVFYTIRYNNNSGTLRLRFERGKESVGSESADYNITLSTSTFTHLVLTYDTTNIRGYVNGIQVGTSTASGSGTSDVFNGFQVLNAPAYANYFSGLVDETAVYNRAITQTEITDLYNGGTGSFYTTSTPPTAAPVSEEEITWW